MLSDALAGHPVACLMANAGGGHSRRRCRRPPVRSLQRFEGLTVTASNHLSELRCCRAHGMRTSAICALRLCPAAARPSARVNGVSLEVAAGEALCPDRRSGSGKSVTLRALMRLASAAPRRVMAGDPASTAPTSPPDRAGSRPPARRHRGNGVPGAAAGAGPGLHGRPADHRMHSHPCSARPPPKRASAPAGAGGGAHSQPGAAAGGLSARDVRAACASAP
ncbi:hypothetical protein ACU4GD_27665 [Cupriavidus basilensis]